jgi:hypothetical protein
MRFGYLLGIALCIFLAGCDDAAWMKKFTPPEEEAISRRYVDLLQQRKFDEIEHDLDPSIKDSNVSDTLAKMAAFFPAETPQSVKVVGAHTFRDQNGSRTDITFEYQYSSKWLLVSVVSEKRGDFRSVVGFHVDLIADSLENLNRFTLVGKSPLQYMTLLCDVGSLLFSLYVFILCAREKNVKPKWLWMVFVLVGAGKFAVNWTTGAWTYQLISVQIPCFSMSRLLYGSWTVAAYLPVGAIAFLQYRWKMRINGEWIPPSPTDQTIPGAGQSGSILNLK